MASLPEMGRTLQTLFTEKAETVAKETGLVKRQSKLTGTLFLIVMVIGFLQDPQASYGLLAQTAFDLGLLITRQGIEERCNEAAIEFMRQMFEYSLEVLQGRAGLPLRLLLQFSGVYLLDSTQVRLPDQFAESYPACGGNGSLAGVKFQVLWDLIFGQIKSLESQSARSNDNSYTDYQEDLPKGSLIMFDLGYVAVKHLAALASRGVCYLCRFNPQTTLYRVGENVAFDLFGYLEENRLSELDLPVELGSQARHETRLLAVKLPEEVATKREKKARQEAARQGRPAPSQSLSWLGWGLYLTNVEASRLSLSQVVLFYRLRWQIEIVFKLWKSGASLSRVAAGKAGRIWVELYAKLIGLVVLAYLSGQWRWQADEATAELSALELGRELSAPKALQTFGREALALGKGLVSGSLAAIVLVLSHLSEKWQRFCLKDQRQQRLATLQQVARAKSEPPPTTAPALPPVVDFASFAYQKQQAAYRALA